MNPADHTGNVARFRPEFIRLPETGERCPWTGMKRGNLRNLCIPTKANDFNPPVRSHCDRKRGNVRGTWYIPYDELIAYIRSLPAVGAPYVEKNSASRSAVPEKQAGQPARASRSRRSGRPAGGFPGARS